MAKIFITAGELSGDLNASLLVRAVRKLSPDTEFVGIGGPKMREAGVRLLADSSSWGSIGIWEGIKKFPRIYPVGRAMPRFFRDEAPDLYVPVDYRVFSVRNAALAKRMGIPVVYFFAPVSWFGTGGKRFEQMRGVVDLALLALPFSLEQYRTADIRAEYIGHPLIDAAKPGMNKETARGFFNVQGEGPIIGFMPGSRSQEVGLLMPAFAGAARLVRENIPGAQMILFSASEHLDPLIERHIGDTGIRIVRENVYDFMNVSDLLVLCSGTATHEAALVGAPMVVTYKLSWFTAWLVRKTVNPPMIGMPNILAGKVIMPEILQEECTPSILSEKILEILSSKEIRAKMCSDLNLVRRKMGEPGVAARAARFVLELLDDKQSAGTLPAAETDNN